MHAIKAEGLKKKYSNKAVVNDLTLTIETGEIVGLLGPNGAGKTTTFYILTGIIKKDKGYIFFDNKEISDKPMYLRARMGISYLPQEPSIFRKLTVRDNIRAVLELNGLISNEKINEKTDKLLEEFDIDNISSSYGYTLSGGQRRRVEIARAIALEPLFILFDEPFTGIDPIAIIELKKMMNYLKNKGIGILITDHNVRETLSITDRAYIISHGKVLDEGKPEKIANNHTVKKAYLGEEFTL
ncbi:lipopolysaccharide ABC transporter ATP-binding protein [Candidatus Magnetoovum chiemensis]|nr:lipopolysaccharide ABC transporter ATP-binding protein [Candidatus Magnetoovum chiemensis]